LQYSVRNLSIRSFLQYSFGLPAWVRGILMCVALNLYSLMSPLWGLIKTALNPYLDLNALAQSPEGALSALVQWADFFALNPHALEELQIRLMTYVGLHVLYMLLMWKMSLWAIQHVKSKVESP
jgi:hypothetical protein